MKTLRILSLLAFVAILGAGLTGCGDDEIASPATSTPAGTDDYTAMDLGEPYGGLTATDEPVAFDDPYLLQEQAREREELHDDALMEQERIREMVAECDSVRDGQTLRQSYFLRVVWGDLDGPVDPATGEVIDAASVDWSGMLQVDEGVVIVRRLIRFERGIDSISRPREDPQTVAWTSYTGGHYDGILFQIVEPHARHERMDGGRDGGMGEPDVENIVHFTAGSFSAEFATSQIPGLDRRAEVADAGSIHFLGFEHNGQLACPRGFLAGIWALDPADAEVDDAMGDGFFRGRWVNALGTTMGYMQGRWGVNEVGERVFAGKYISRRGQFRGLLSGTWEPGDEPGVGSFTGEWVNGAETREGVLGGRYLQAGDRPGGFYQGRWTATCDAEAVAMIE